MEPNQGFRYGDITWVRVDDCSWWPVQVVDENTVSRNNKPKRKAVGEILVRLYGSYEYLYVDPVRCGYAFESKNIANAKETMQEALEVISRTCFRCKFTVRIKESKEGAIEEDSKNKKLKNHRIERNHEADCLASAGGCLKEVRSNLENGTGKAKEGISQDKQKKQQETTKVADKLEDESFGQSGKEFKVTEEAGYGHHKIMKQNENGVRKYRQHYERKAKATDKTKDISSTQDSERKPKAIKKADDKSKVVQKLDDGSSKQKTEVGKSMVQDFKKSPGKDYCGLAKTPKGSVRRIRVMQSLGLLAPSGSPFKN